MDQQADWNIEFYTDARGRSPALEYIDELPAQERAVIISKLRLLREAGPMLGFPNARPIDDIWELRPGPNRLLYFLYMERRFVILHAFRKQSQKTPKREIKTALRRRLDFLQREQDGR